MSACAEPARDVSYAERRLAPPLAEPVLSISDSQRFGAKSAQPAPKSNANESPLVWMSPPGWEELPSTSMRLANFSVGAEAECYLTILPGTGGGVVGNVNRWREQIGLAEISAEEVALLPRVPLLGTDAYLVELEGAFRGMGTEAKEGWGLRGAILGSDRFTIFVKFTGPAEVVSLEAEAFDAFCASITMREQEAGPSPSPSSSHGAAGGIGWDVPAEWTTEPGGGMRLVTFRRGGVECYLTVLGGDGGGVVPNIQRWVGQLGLTPPTPDEVAALPKVEVMGVPSPLLEATGEYTGMGASGPIPDTTMYGIACILEDRAIFVKMLGPSAEVLAERERFTAFVASMHLEDGGH
ncbi:MAG: hypothetical protein MK291_09130 [Planctomycetes bacterium]|nr:hypothetical protein [Planctomycetota bacterium]